MKKMFHYNHWPDVFTPLYIALTGESLAYTLGSTAAAGAITAGATVGAGMYAAKSLMPKSQKIPGMATVDPTKTATTLPQLSEQAKRNKQMAASLLMKDFTIPPKLGKTGLLGLGTV